jgi:hypothetical protein
MPSIVKRYSSETIIALSCLLVLSLGFLVRCHGATLAVTRPATDSVTTASIVGALERANAFPPLKTVPLKSSYSIDTILQGGSSQPVAGDRAVTVHVKQNRSFIVVGWAVDSVARKAAAGAYITIDGVRQIPALYGNARPDVSSVLGYEASDCGYAALVDADTVTPGRHVLGIAIIDAAQNEIYEESSSVSLVVDGTPS